MNPCHDMEPLLSGLLDDELIAAQRAVIFEHLAACQPCAVRYRELQQVDAVLARGTLGTSDSLLASLADIPRQARRRAIGRLALASAGAAAFILAASWLQFPHAAAHAVSDPFESLRLIHRVQESAQRSTLNTCEWDLRLLKLQVDRLQVPPERKSELLVRIEQLRQRVRLEQSMSPSLHSGV